MRACLRWALTAAWIATHASALRAQPGAWIEVQAPERCTAAAELSARVEQALIGRAGELRATVSIEPRAGAFRLAVRAYRGAASLGETVLVVPSCGEAVDAAVVVLALALGEEARADAAPALAPRPAEPPRVDARPTLADPPRARPHAVEEAPIAPRARAQPGAAAAAAEPYAGDPGATRLSLAAGVDAGTLPVTTAFLSAGLARLVGPLELGGRIGLGLPYIEENELAAGPSERRRGDFAVVDLALCYGAGARWHLAGCAGGELGLLRSTRSLRGGAELDMDTDELRPRLAGLLGLRLGYRAGAIQPELELSSVAVAVGRSDPRWLSLRLTLGAGLQF